MRSCAASAASAESERESARTGQALSCGAGAQVLGEGASNEEVYQRCGSPLVRYVFEKQGKASCFAYGQTGSGKTHTMMGNPQQPGLYFLAADEIFTIKEQQGHADMTVWVAFFEIYSGKLYDLLNDRRKLVPPPTISPTCPPTAPTRGSGAADVCTSLSPSSLPSPPPPNRASTDAGASGRWHARTRGIW